MSLEELAETVGAGVLVVKVEKVVGTTEVDSVGMVGSTIGTEEWVVGTGTAVVELVEMAELEDDCSELGAGLSGEGLATATFLMGVEEVLVAGGTVLDTTIGVPSIVVVPMMTGASVTKVPSVSSITVTASVITTSSMINALLRASYLPAKTPLVSREVAKRPQEKTEESILFDWVCKGRGFGASLRLNILMSVVQREKGKASQRVSRLNIVV